MFAGLSMAIILALAFVVSVVVFFIGIISFRRFVFIDFILLITKYYFAYYRVCSIAGYSEKKN